MTDKHKHEHCNHEGHLHYCEHCNVVYCDACGQEFPEKITYWYTVPYYTGNWPTTIPTEPYRITCESNTSTGMIYDGITPLHKHTP